MARRILLTTTLLGLLAGVLSCSEAPAPQMSGSVPVLVFGEPAKPGPSASPSASASAGASAKPVVVRPTPTPRPGLYASPAWSLMIVGDDVMDAAFTRLAYWRMFWPEVYKAEPPTAYWRTKVGESTVEAVGRLDAMLVGVKDVKYAAITFGPTDVRTSVPIETFKGNLRTIIGKLRDNGMIVYLSSVPFMNNPKLEEQAEAYNQAALAVRDELKAEAGPDLRTYMRDHPELFAPKSPLKLSAAGAKDVHNQWAALIAKAAEGDPHLPDPDATPSSSPSP
jgi:hypothetical protein